MGTVHRAVVEGARGFTKPVVIKRILGELSGNSEFAERLLQEAKLCALLHHPSIVQAHDFGEVDGELFLAMELIEGLDLVTVVRICKQTKTAIPPAVVCHIIAEL